MLILHNPISGLVVVIGWAGEKISIQPWNWKTEKCTQGAKWAWTVGSTRLYLFTPGSLNVGTAATAGLIL